MRAGRSTSGMDASYEEIRVNAGTAGKLDVETESTGRASMQKFREGEWIEFD